MQNLLHNRHTPFWLLAFGMLIGFTVPVLIQDGMFMDAMLYTSVSHNMSMGIGDFWFPFFSDQNVANLPSFHEQPPLVFGIQAVFFKIFGDSMYVERLYTFLTMCISAWLIVLLWREIFREKKEGQRAAWLPLMLWITIPVCFWSYSNNMHENTMGIFTLGSVLFIYKSFRQDKKQYFHLFLGGVFVFLASFSKGIPGLFPIGVPFLYWLVTRKINFKKVTVDSLILVVIPAVAYFLIILSPDGKESLSNYFIKRALHRINQAPTVNTRFYILWSIFMEILPQLSVAGFLYIFARTRKLNINLSENVKEALFFYLVGLSASAPLMLTLVQKTFYFVPALPFFAIGTAVFLMPVIIPLLEKIKTSSVKFKTTLGISFVLLLGTITVSFMQKGKFSRNEDILHDVYIIGDIVPGKTKITIPHELWNEWDFKCYLVRYFMISPVTFPGSDFLVIRKTMPADTILYYHKLNLETKVYDIYQKND